jgi:hypothetical protein
MVIVRSFSKRLIIKIYEVPLIEFVTPLFMFTVYKYVFWIVDVQPWDD